MFDKIKKWYYRNEEIILSFAASVCIGAVAGMAYTVGHIDGAAGQLSADREWVLAHILDGTITVKSAE